jgi:hypothetical protein
MSAVAALLITIIPNPIEVVQNEFIYDFTVTLSGNYPANGDTLDLTPLSPSSGLLPNKVELWEATPASAKPASGFSFVYLPGTTQANGLLELFNGTTQGTAEAYSSLIANLTTGFVLRGRAWFTKYV